MEEHTIFLCSQDGFQLNLTCFSMFVQSLIPSVHQLTAAVFIVINGLFSIDKDNQWENGLKKTLRQLFRGEVNFRVFGRLFSLLCFSKRIYLVL